MVTRGRCSDPEYARHDLIENEAAEVVHDARALADLARLTLVSRLRDKRARAARLVVTATGCKEDATAVLGISRRPSTT